jgi:hypothetical protein
LPVAARIEHDDNVSLNAASYTEANRLDKGGPMHWNNVFRAEYRRFASGLRRVQRPAVAIPMRIFCVICCGMLVYLPAEMPAHAQDQLASPSKSDAGKPSEHSIQGDLNSALAAQWAKADSIDALLKVFGLLTSGPSPFATDGGDTTKEVLSELKKIDADNEPLYEAAMGNPDENGHPSVPPPVSLLDTLAQATTQTLPTDDDDKQVAETQIFVTVNTIISRLYAAAGGGGEREIVGVDASFQEGGSSNYVALYNLLSAYFHLFSGDSNTPKDLETLRAAFKDSPVRMAKIVHAKVGSTSK